jgi:hypothetical protein
MRPTQERHLTRHRWTIDEPLPKRLPRLKQLPSPLVTLLKMKKMMKKMLLLLLLPSLRPMTAILRQNRER